MNFNWADFGSTNGYSRSPTYTNGSNSANGPTTYHERFLVAGLTTQVKSASVNQIHFQFGRDLETAGANAPGPVDRPGSLLTYGMPNALPRIAEPDEHRIQFTDVFSTVHGHHSIKFGGDTNIIHEVMINLYPGWRRLQLQRRTPLINFQNWAADSFHGQAGDTDPYAGYHYTSFVQTLDQMNTGNRAGADDFWFKIFDGFVEDSWKVRPNFTLNTGVRYDAQLTPAPIMINTNFPRSRPSTAPPSRTCSIVYSRVWASAGRPTRDRGSRRLWYVLRPQPGKHLLRHAR